MKPDKLKIVFTNYKKYLIPLGVIMGVLLLIFLVIIPQTTTIIDKLQLIDIQKEELETLNSSLTTVQSINDEELDSDFNLVTKALPPEKNVELIFTALSDAAANSGTQLEDFSVELGGIYGKSVAGSTKTVGSPTIQVSAHIAGGDARSVNEFMKELAHTLPLSETTKLDITGGSGSYKINFFFKPIDVSNVANNYSVKPFSEQQKKLLEQLRGWE